MQEKRHPVAQLCCTGGLAPSPRRARSDVEPRFARGAPPPTPGHPRFRRNSRLFSCCLLPTWHLAAPGQTGFPETRASWPVLRHGGGQEGPCW